MVPIVLIQAINTIHTYNTYRQDAKMAVLNGINQKFGCLNSAEALDRIATASY